MRTFNYDYIMVDGKLYDTPNSAQYCPSDSQASNIMSDVLPYASGRTLHVTLAASEFLHRKAGRASLKISYEGEMAMSGVMERHLRLLYATQRPFWVEFDALLSRNFAVCQPADSTGLTWIAPTFPIAPRATDPGEALVWTGCVYVNGKLKATGWTIDEAEGLVTFDPEEAVTLHSKVQIHYRWRMAAVLTILATQDARVGKTTPAARGAYNGAILLEQWKGTLPAWTVPTVADDFDSEDEE